MNILWLSWKDRANPLSGGAEVVTDELARRLTSDGHVVTLLTSGFAGAPPKTKTGGYRVVRVGGRFSVYLQAWRWYRKYGHGKFDLVIDECNTIPFGAKLYARTKTIMFFHMLCREIWFYELPQPVSTLGYLIEPLYLRLLSRMPVITVSESTRQDLLRHGFKPDRIKLISEGIEISPVADLALIQKFAEPTMLSLGAMRAMKRPLDQVKAFEFAKLTIPKLKLKLAGDNTGPYARRVLDYINSSPHKSDIEVLGRVTKAQKVALMQQAHVITVTSIKEGWGLIVTEAASQGTPAVVYDVDGLRDSVKDGITGLVVSTNTPQALAAKLARLLKDPGQYAKLRLAAWTWSRDITFERSYSEFMRALSL
jgi:glycosyltransferase involved in cell wall biosynthesis